MSKKYANLSTLQTFLNNLKNLFATKVDIENTNSSIHEITTNVQSKLDEAKEYTDTVASEKADSEHIHAISDVIDLQSNLATINDTLSSKADASSIPTTTSQLTNDSGYITEDAITVITTTEIDEICGSSIVAASEVTF